MSELLESLDTAVTRLAEALQVPETDLVRDASIQRFESCFELSWKAAQHALRHVGIERASPRECLRAAWQQGWLEDERLWLAMLGDRNLTTHAYDEDLAQVVYDRLPGYLPALRSLLERLRAVGGD